MARTFRMSWDDRNKQWQKMVRGQRLRVTCSELGCAPTKEDSYRAANAWLEKQLKSEAPNKIAPTNELEVAPEAAASLRRLAAHRRGLNVGAGTIGSNLQEFLTLEKIRIKPQSYRELKNYLDNLTTDSDFFHRDAGLSEITAATVNDHYRWLGNLQIENAGRNKYLGFFRRFVKWLAENERITAPANLKSRTHRFKTPNKKIKTFSDSTVAETLETLPDDFKLCALLGLNCGMTQADWGALEWSQIDLRAGTLTRSRVKLEGQKNAPEVTYKLWPETLELLRSRKNKHGLVWQTENGLPWYVAKYDQATGKETKKDLFSTYFNRLENKPRIPLGKWRSIGCSALKRSPLYRGFETYFLANIERGTAGKFYGAEWNDAFFQALQFSHDQLFPQADGKKSA